MQFERVFLAVIFAICVSFCGGCNSKENGSSKSSETTKATQPADKPDELSTVDRLISSEELILELTQSMGKLNRSALNLCVPDSNSMDLFTDDATSVDVAATGSPMPISDYVSKTQWELATVPSPAANQILVTFFETAEYLKSAKFYFIDGLVSADSKSFDATMGFAAHFVDKQSKVGYATGKFSVRWRLPEKKIVNWTTKEFQTIHSDQLLFNDVTNSVVDSNLARELGRSLQEELTRKIILGGAIKLNTGQKYNLFFPEVTLEHPAVSVVDFDSDGLDDFFLGRIFSPSLMFRNRGDGTFEEVGEQIGLRIPNDCTCALFADFDNDSDPDVFIGRARNRAIYLKNESGVFSPAPELTKKVDLPYMVSSISAADFNKDGLLDIYFCTYSPIEGNHSNILRDGNQWPKHFLSTIEQVDFEEKRKTAHPYLNMVGPPNVLLENQGDQFRISKHGFDVECWRKTFQSSWCDFDQDGDPDLYVCNDFSPDDLFRNDLEQGFTRVSDEIGLDRIGFGMGVSWQDHNNDGFFDLYVSNMYSKAGTRITRQIDDLDDRISQLASGNYLYEFDGQKFKLASEKGKNKTVSKTGWSWGGQMTDFDNDGKHDIVVANGYYSVPPQVEIKVDL